MLRRFANSGNRPKHKNRSLRPVNGKENQNYSTTLISFRGISHGTQGAEGRKEAALVTVFLQRKEKHYKFAENLCGRILFADFRLALEGWNLTVNETDEYT